MSTSPITGPLVLPADVTIVPVTSFPADIRSRLPQGEYAVTRPRSRTTSRVVGTDAADLLQRFRVPGTLVEVVVDYSRARAVDPKSTLADVIPLIRDLLSARLLLPAGPEAGDEIRASLRTGDRVGGMTVHRPIQVLEDVEVYQGSTSDSTPVALKIGRGELGGHGQAAFCREAAILQYLDGRVAPRVLERGESGDRPFLVLDWCEGVDVEVAADEWRSVDDSEGRDARILLCQAVLDAYATLHRLGVLHGDVHPRNVLVDGKGRVRLIDFAFARADEHTPDAGPPPRVGIGFFFDPQYACAVKAGVQPPGVTAAAEQYAVAALLYAMLTGALYLDFSLEPREALRQIVEEHPVAFARRGLTGWEHIEAAVAVALRKDPARRYESVAAFADAFRAGAASDACASAASAASAASRRPLTAERDRPQREWCESILARLAIGGPALGSGVREPPTGSVTYGAAGIGYALYRIALQRGDPRTLALADVWTATAERDLHHADAFRNASESITIDNVSASSPFHSVPGVRAVRALIAHAFGDLSGWAAAVAHFRAASGTAGDRPELTLDLTLGRTGVLLAASLLLEAAPDPGQVDLAPLVRVGEEALAAIWARVSGSGPLAESELLPLTGIAHGWAGVLYATLRWCSASRVAAPVELPGRLSELADLAQPVGRGACWPRRLADRFGGPDGLASWCNGSAGLVHLWTVAFKTTHAERFLLLAERAAWHAWEHPDTYPDLCCGLAGRAYALLELYRLTHDRVWLRRAERLATAAYRGADILASHPDSLYKGRVGVATLIAELERPEEAAMPFFAAEGWPTPPQSREGVPH